ncbi:PREDICTED: transcription factor COE2-like [Amphimedon queenslandica]|uniref:IPT/TIG domain-containing protein n=1 Tax=Amphimedon queenslandica TaxID=400682 RepID=A0A1X7VR98_AMPQE|nr:PREDICTED: transcription factor COE2-like [Amphimedon queenslandica]XP_019859126.1 PREDICTED: transcription factor COE2-like [Amphimedon queenslandica]|eukprot:XP_011408942.1 PREDICTED: transcription factor COE2-like [Amphimedon queenslandica]
MAHESSLSPPVPSGEHIPPPLINHTLPQRSTPYYIAAAQFEKQPPDNMRKSNFFHFIISLFDGQQHRIQVQKAVFKDFYDTVGTDEQEYRNGLIYKLLVVYSDGTQKEEELCVRLIDSNTKQLVPYEGTNKNPDFRRVLLTHELICSRCLERRSCGNKNDTPSDPIILDNFRLKIFAKCNQNCLKNAGNPKDSRRRFQVALYEIDKVSGQPIACSDSMFVHNNSKHGRRPIYRDNVVGDGKPCIVSIYPNEGWTTGGSRITVIGVNFFEGLDIVFGTVPVQSEVLSPNAIAVRTPPATMTGEVDVTLIFRASGAQFCISNPGKFLYTAPDDQIFENSFCRIERVIRQQDDPDQLPKDLVLQRAAELLESCFLSSRGAQSSTVPFGQAPFVYPPSPALIGSNGVFLFTPQPLTPRQGSNGGMLPMSEGLGGGFGYGGGMPNTNGDVYPRHSYMPQTAFPFPEITQHGDPGGSMSTEVKSESQMSSPSQQGLHKSTLANGMVMPFNLPYETAPPYGSNSLPLTHGAGQVNTNNNNSTSVTDSAHIGQMAGSNSLAYMSRLFPGGVPPSPGFLMTHTFSPIPTTPTSMSGGGGLNNQFFAFNSPLLSPTKGRMAKTARPNPLSLSMSNEMPNGISSPNLGSTFTFPPITPSALIAPINLPDLTGGGGGSEVQDPLSVNSGATSGSSTLHSTSLPQTPPPPSSRKRKHDGSPTTELR